MQLEITKIIDRYLMGELSEEDRLAFEARLSTNKALQQELALQRMIQEAAIRASFRSDVQQTARRYKLNRVMKWGSIGFGGLALIALMFWGLNGSKSFDQSQKTPVIAQSVINKMNPSAEFERLPIQYFSVPKEGDVFLSDQSVLLSVPKNAFLLRNKPYSGEAIVQYQEALTANEIVKAGLNTMTGTHLLETQGMFSIHAYTSAGQKLELNPAVGIYVQVPVDEYKDGMQLYDLVNLPNGKSDWQNPRALEKIPLPVAMTELDFYPTGYEKELDNLKWKQSKRQRDSLYLSFENYCGETRAITSSAAEPRSINQIQSTERKDIVGAPHAEAMFTGGNIAMRTFISNATKYPQKAVERGLQGTVYLSFIVEKSGEISDIRVERGIDPLLDQEAVRIVQSMPKWQAAVSLNGAVATRVRLPISFTLSGGSGGGSIKKLLMASSGVSSSPPQVEPRTSFTSAAKQGTVLYDSIVDTPCDFPHISPSRVLAFWKPKFNNTNLATREFEQRMKAIHGTCNNAVLQKYTSQLKKSLSQIDQEVADMGYSEFADFAREQVGAVDVNNPHLRNLQAFYEQGIVALQQEAKTNANWERSLRDKWDANLALLRQAHTVSKRTNNNNAEQQEIAFNQQRTIQKLGLSVQRIDPVTAYPQFRNRIGFVARRSGGYNCDRQIVREMMTYETVSLARSVTAIVVPAIPSRAEQRIEVAEQVRIGSAGRTTFDVTMNGQTRTITYNKMNFSVENQEKYDRLFAYIFPHGLESYQIIDGSNGKFEYQLNDDIVYDLCIVGINEDGYAYFQKQTFNGGNLGSISLSWLTEKNLDANLLQMNAKRGSRVSSLQPDLAWIKAERANYKEIDRRKEMEVFRKNLVKTVYPCFGESGVVASDENPFGI